MSIDKEKSIRVLLAIVVVFAAAFAVRYATYKDVSITLDEVFYWKGGLSYLGALAKLPSIDSAWGFNTEHPPISKYLYGLAVYLFDGARSDYGSYLVSRALSIACGAITCVLTYLIGRRFFNGYVGILAGLILAFTPMMIAHNQLCNIDSPVTMFLTATMLVFLMAVQARSLKLYLASALLLGLSLATKYNSLLIIPVMVGVYLLARFYANDASIAKTARDLASKPSRLLVPALLAIIVAATFLAVWPYLWPDPIGRLQQSVAHWSGGTLPEELLGNSINGAPWYYYPLYFLVTTPEILLLALAIGLVYLARSKDAFKQGMALWLFLPFAYGLSHFVMGSMRYILMIYPALALICAFGVFSLAGTIAGHLRNSRITLPAVSMALGAIVVVSLLLTCLSVQPLYLDYYNSLSGGYKNIYDNKMFLLSWWGEGLYDPVQYVETHASGATVSVIDSGIINANEYVGTYAKNNNYTSAGGMGGGPGGGMMPSGAPPNMAMPGNFTGGPPSPGTAMGLSQSGAPPQGAMPGTPPAGFAANGMPPGGSPFDAGSAMAYGPPFGNGTIANLENLTSDYIIVETYSNAYAGLNTTNYTLAYQDMFNGVPLYDVYRRTA